MKHKNDDCTVPFCDKCLANIKRVADEGRKQLGEALLARERTQDPVGRTLAPVSDDIDRELDKKLKTAYELARAATDTEEGRKAIDFFYHVHLNSYPGFAHSLLNTQTTRLLDRVEKEVIGEDKQSPYGGSPSPNSPYAVENSLRAEQRQRLQSLRGKS